MSRAYSLVSLEFLSVMRSSHFALLSVLALTSCAPAKTRTNDELRSDLRSALSLASETDLFIVQIESGRLVASFRRGHADHLREEAQRQAKEALESRKGSDAVTFALCAEQLGLLSDELKAIRIAGDRETLSKSRQRVEIIRKTLIDAGAGR